MSEESLAAGVALQGLRPALPACAPPGYARLASACWAAEPAARPGFPAIVSALKALAAAQPPVAPRRGSSSAGPMTPPGRGPSLPPIRVP